MLRKLCIAVLFASFIASCGSNVVEHSVDSVATDTTGVFSNDSAKTESSLIKTDLRSQLTEISFPYWVHVDTAFPNDIKLTHRQAIDLFPSGFGIPEEVNVFAIGKHLVEPGVFAFWYRMEVQGSENKDVWVVLYNDTATLNAHLAATKGNGLIYGRIDSPTFIREVTVDAGVKTNVTTKTVIIGKGNFGNSDEQKSTCANAAEAQVVIDKFLR